MVKEADQTKWVGVRPTDPPEDLPITLNGEVIHVIVDSGMGAYVKSLQWGTIALTTELNKYVTISEVDKDYSILILTGIATDADDLVSSLCRLVFVSDTQIYIARQTNTANIVAGYMVVELNGLPKKVQHKTITCDGVADNTAALTEVNLDKTILIHNGVQCDTDDVRCGGARILLLNSTTAMALFGAATGWKCVNFEVVSLPL